MKMKYFAVLAAVLVFATTGRAGIVLQFGESNLSAAIPDNNLSGLSRSSVQSGYDNYIILSLTVNFRITSTGLGAFNGDFYSDLRHVSADGTTTRLAVLLNRVGRTTSMLSGYSDDEGMNVTLSDSAEADIHNYRLTLNGSNTTPLTGPLTGTWQPDGRNVSPDLSLESTPRTAFLNQLAGAVPNGTWTFFISDVKAGGTSQLMDWQVTIQAAAIPEPGTWAAAALLVGAAGYVRWRKRASLKS